ncbi:hypothetical protein ACP4OV_013436 [Aristida adscensionis]
MEDSSLFMQWAMATLQHEQPGPAPSDGSCGPAAFPSLEALREASLAAEMVQEMIAEGSDATNSWSSGDTTDGGSVGNISAPPAMDHDIWPPSPNSARPTANRSSGAGAANLPTSWNFSSGTGRDGAPKAAAATGGPPELVYGSPPARRSGPKSAGSMSSPNLQDHVIAERKRREKINQRFIELSAVIPGLKKMDKATILSDATRHVKELQEKLKALQARGIDRSTESVALAKKPCIAVPGECSSPSRKSSGTPPARKPVPEIEARFSEKTAMVRIHCEDGKGAVVRVLAEVEELHLSILHANVMPFSDCTLIITITAKVEEGLGVTAEEIVPRLTSALRHKHNNYHSSE